MGVLDGGVTGDLTLLVERDQGGVHQVVAFAAGGGNGVGDLGGLALADQVANGAVGDHDFRCQDAAPSGKVGQKLLADDGLEAHGQLHADLGLLLGGENVHDTVHGVRCGVGMESRKDQVTGLGGDQGGFNGGKGAHFADQNDIGVFPEDGTEAVGIGTGVLAYLALVDDALVGGVNVLDGVFQGDDVLGLGVVDLIQQAGQGGGLAGAGFAGDQDDALVEIGEVLDVVGKTQFLKGGDVVIEDTDGGGDIALLAEQVHAAAGAVGEADGKVLLADVGDVIVVTGQVPGIGFAVFGGHDVGIQVMKPSVDAEADGNAADDVNVAGAHFLGLGDDLGKGVDLAHDGLSPFL